MESCRGPGSQKSSPLGNSVLQAAFTPLLPPQALEKRASGEQGPGCGVRPVGPDSPSRIPLGCWCPWRHWVTRGQWLSLLRNIGRKKRLLCTKGSQETLLIPALFSLKAPLVMSSFDLCAPWDGSLEQRPASPLCR